MTSTMESIIESLQRTCQLMVQEVERSANTLATFEESTSVLKKAEGEYKGHRSLLMRTRRLLSTMQCQDVMDRISHVLIHGAVCCVEMGWAAKVAEEAAWSHQGRFKRT
ncbi:uncharacterized protein [Elaeis guineensis]|uniref:uncharacterized protein isoform X1 n=1 Tax=Elaeis guineensis var. tenera TaxID=51953 RepID=UPI003C6D4474